MPRYHLYQGRDRLETFTVADRPRTIIGRGENADIRLDNPAVSREHAEIRKVGAGYVIQALGAKNGLFVNGRWVNTLPLKDGDKIEILKYVILVDYPVSEQELDRANARGGLQSAFKMDPQALLHATRDEGGDPARRRAPALPTDPRASTFTVSPDDLVRLRDQARKRQQAHLKSSDGAAPATFPLAGREATTLGSSPSADLRVQSLLLKGIAATFRQKGKEWWLHSHGGLAPVRVNGEPLKGDAPRRLVSEDRIEAGGRQFVFYDEM